MSHALWYGSRQWVKDGFNATFAFSVSDSQPGGGDGIAFVVSGVRRDRIPVPNLVGASGGGLGYSGLGRTIAVEFDMHLDPEQHDPNSNHISVHSLQNRPNSAVELRSPNGGLLESSPLINTDPFGSPAQLLSVGTHNVTLNYVASSGLNPYLQVYLDQIPTPVITTYVDLETIGLIRARTDIVGHPKKYSDAGYAYIGVTSSTGNAYQIHNLHSLTFSGTPVAISLYPHFGSRNGGPVWVQGSNFKNDTYLRCRFGSVESNGTFVNSDTLMCPALGVANETIVNFAFSTQPEIWIETNLTYAYVDLTYNPPAGDASSSQFCTHVVAMLAAVALVCLF